MCFQYPEEAEGLFLLFFSPQPTIEFLIFSDHVSSSLFINYLFLLLLFLIFNRVAVLGLGCIMQDLSLRHVECLVAACGRSRSMAFGILALQPGNQPVSCALQGGFLTPGAPGKSHYLFWWPRLTD